MVAVRQREFAAVAALGEGVVIREVARLLRARHDAGLLSAPNILAIVGPLLAADIWAIVGPLLAANIRAIVGPLLAANILAIVGPLSAANMLAIVGPLLAANILAVVGLLFAMNMFVIAGLPLAAKHFGHYSSTCAGSNELARPAGMPVPTPETWMEPHTSGSILVIRRFHVE